MVLSKAHQMQLNAARTVGGSPSVYLTNAELVYLLCVVCADLELPFPSALNCSQCRDTGASFFGIPVDEVRCPQISDAPADDDKFVAMLDEVLRPDPDIFTYFWALTILHAQRRKFRSILVMQSLPDLETVIPRGLLELGQLPPDALASWLIWRKFIYDIDNRAAQTTGYLFEPILAASLGGASYSANKSPVRRKGSGSGRQVDCVVNKNAYEFKMRVTLAASGQGRFREELNFAQDCQLSGYRPILLVLDPTPSAKLDELSAAYRQFDGDAYIGEAAWSHIATKAGPIMARFVARYVREPIARMDDAADPAMQSIALNFDPQTDQIVLTIGSNSYSLR